MYVSSIATTQRRISPTRNRNLAPHRTGTGLGPVSMSLLLAMIIGVLALLYLTQITKTSVYGFQVSNLGAERKQLVEQQQALQVEAARLRSLANVEDRNVVGRLTSEQNPTFLNSNDGGDVDSAPSSRPSAVTPSETASPAATAANDPVSQTVGEVTATANDLLGQ